MNINIFNLTYTFNLYKPYILFVIITYLKNLIGTETVMIYLISNCTNSKKLLPPHSLILENYSFSDIDKSLINWKKNLNIYRSDITIAKELYKGHSWQETLKYINILSQKFKTKLLISSAGYGLIDSSKQISSYQATFSKSNPNSIHNFKNNTLLTPTVEWWDNVNDFNISRINKNSYMFIAVSYEYLVAMENTIKELIETLGDKIFIIVLSKEILPKIYDKNILRFDTRFNSFEKGTINSIIPRFTKWLFNEIVTLDLELDNKKLQNHIDDFLSNFSAYTIPNRKQLSDIEILNIIKEQINIKHIMTKTKGLKDLRSQGYACSQDRYGKLYKKVKGEKNG